MKEYDFAFSLGFCCTCSESLRAEGLQFVSLPFDWVGISNVLQAPRVIADDFKNWFDRRLLRLWDVRITGGFVTRVYRNMETGIGFVHDFSNAYPLECGYDEVRLKYERRIARLMSRLERASRVLAVYLEVPKKSCANTDDLYEARRLLSSRFPNANIDILYVYEDPLASKWECVRELNGITIIKADYRIFFRGELMHLCRNDQLRDCLRSLVRVKDTRTEEEKRRFDALKRHERSAMLGGGGRLRQWINKKMLRCFRNAEEYLERQNLLPSDRPLWFDGDGK